MMNALIYGILSILFLVLCRLSSRVSVLDEIGAVTGNVACILSLLFMLVSLFFLVSACECIVINSNAAVATSETAMREDQENNIVEIDGKTYVLVDGSAYQLQQ